MAPGLDSKPGQPLYRRVPETERTDVPITYSSFSRLVRLPAALTAPGDSIAGATAAGWPMGMRSAVLPVSSVFIYWAGMALNDFADRDLDSRERPERPIPSGDITPREALAVAAGLTALGVAVAAAGGGRRALAVALPLAASAWSYDLCFKSTPFGPASMALTRSLDVLLGAGYGSLRTALPSALVIGTHIMATTILSRDEVHGSSDAATGSIAVAGTAVASLAAASALIPSPRTGALANVGWVLGSLLAAGYATVVGVPQWTARTTRTAQDIRRAVGASVIGTIPLQAALIARSGGILSSIAIAALWPVAKSMTRKVSAT